MKQLFSDIGREGIWNLIPGEVKQLRPAIICAEFTAREFPSHSTEKDRFTKHSQWRSPIRKAIFKEAKMTKAHRAEHPGGGSSTEVP
jgi:hypothetical protein